MTLDEAIEIFDKSAARTRPNAQTKAWSVIKQQLAAAREALTRAGELVQKFSDAAEHWEEAGNDDIACTFYDCADDLAATLQRDRQP